MVVVCVKPSPRNADTVVGKTLRCGVENGRYKIKIRVSGWKVWSKAKTQTHFTSPLAITISTTPSWIKYIFVPIVPSLIIISLGWNTSYFNFVTTSDTKFWSALAKKGTDATRDLHKKRKRDKWKSISETKCWEVCTVQCKWHGKWNVRSQPHKASGANWKTEWDLRRKKAKRRVPSKTIKIQDPNENNEKG